MTAPPVALLVLAKAPEPGRVKTRLCPPATPTQAADLAAAALLDTLHALRAVPGDRPVVALSGNIANARRRPELLTALSGIPTVPQRGESLGARIAAAHADTAKLLPAMPILQLGMDTPQVTAELLEMCRHTLCRSGVDGVLGPACDGGWWILGLHQPHHAGLVRKVPTSRPDTGARTATALGAAGLNLVPLPELTDVDTMADARHVARIAPTTRWHRHADRGDRWLVRRCHGPTLDLGCGPGRLVTALLARGVPALGVDVSPLAVRYCQRRGAPALQRDAFAPLPEEGRWRHVLLADGNIGIGGDPLRLLRRAATLIGSIGTILVELHRPATGLWRGNARLRGPAGRGPWFPWATVGAEALPALAATAGLRLTTMRRWHRRDFAELVASSG